MPGLTILFLLGNPVTRRANYRAFTVSRFPALRLLDGQRVTAAERLAVNKWSRSKAGRAAVAEAERMAANAQALAKARALTAAADGDAATLTYSAAAAGLGPPSVPTLVVSAPAVPTLPPLLRLRVNEAIAAARTLAEVDALEAALRGGETAVIALLGGGGGTSAAVTVTTWRFNISTARPTTLSPS